MGIEMAKIRKLFLKIGSFGYTIGCLKADINAGIGIAYIKGRQQAKVNRQQVIASCL